MIKLNFDLIKTMFDGHLTMIQESGLNNIIKSINDYGVQDPRFAAYMLATVYHETAKVMLPLREYGQGKNHTYGNIDPVTKQAYYGRGYVQLTWKYNYQKFADILKLDLVNHPDLVLNPSTSAKIMLIGMSKGLFTGKSLSDYIRPEHTDFVNARRIINGTDKAQLIAGYAETFLKALKG
jgi:putative chitinase